MSEKKTVLAIETSTKKGSISILSEDEVIETYQLADNEPVSEFLLTKIKELLKRNNLTLVDLGLVAVSLGPGSLTGLRVGIAIGQGLANSLGISCIGISIFEAMVKFHDVDNAVYVIGAGSRKFYWLIKESEELSNIKTGSIEELLAELELNITKTIFTTKDASDNILQMSPAIENKLKFSIVNNLVQLIGKFRLTQLNNKLNPIYIGETGFKKIST